MIFIVKNAASGKYEKCNAVAEFEALVKYTN